MIFNKRIKELEKRVKELEQVLCAAKKFMEQYLKDNNETFALDYLFSMESPIEDIYCVLKSIDNRIKRLERKKAQKNKKYQKND